MAFAGSKIILNEVEVAAENGSGPSDQDQRRDSWARNRGATRLSYEGTRAGGDMGGANPSGSKPGGAYYAASPIRPDLVRGVRLIPVRNTPERMLRDAIKPKARPNKKRDKIRYDAKHQPTRRTPEGTPLEFSVEGPHTSPTGRGGVTPVKPYQSEIEWAKDLLKGENME